MRPVPKLLRAYRKAGSGEDHQYDGDCGVFDFVKADGYNLKDHSPAPAARFIPNSSRKGAKDAKDAKEEERRRKEDGTL